MREKMVSISNISSYTTLLGDNYYSYFVREKIKVSEMLSNFQKITQFSSVAELCSTLCDPMNCSTPGLPAHYLLPELAQIHVHQVDDAIQPSHLLSSPSPAFNLSQHQGLFK